MIKYSARKYIVTTVFAASLLFTPILGSSVFAYGGPDADASNESTVTVTEQPQQEQAEETQSVVPTNSGLITRGDRGAAVEGLQDVLTNKGYQTAADGIFGGDTEQKLKAFQGDAGLAVDGIAGPATIDALNGETTVAKDSGQIELTEVEQTAPSKETSVKSATVDAEANSDVASIAQSLVGSPYKFGGTTPDGFDSSGFINYAFSQAGVSLDRTHAGMWANNGVKVDSPAVGDVVFFANTYKSGVSHSGIYIGNGQMIHAGTEETGVEVTSMEIDYWADRYIGAKRFN